jgi:DNA-directed RNA polymerase specialized sigma24 family protein
MRDAEVVVTIVAGDLSGLAEAYDRYADRLHSYCWFMLGDPADAADAVTDAFLTADARLGRLRKPGYLRPWLYAVARNECLRRLRALGREAEGPGEPALSRASGAAARLRLREREAVELCVGHDMEPAEAALATGVSHQRMQSLLSRALDKLDLAPGAALAALAALSPRPADGSGAPASLRDHVLWSASSQADEPRSRQADVRSRSRARAFRRNGFPRPLPMPAGARLRSRRRQLAVLAGAVTGVAAVGVVLALTVNWQSGLGAGPLAAGNASPQATAGSAAAAPVIMPPAMPTKDAPVTSDPTTGPALAVTQSPGRPAAFRQPASKPSGTAPAGTPAAARSSAPSDAPTVQPTANPSATLTVNPVQGNVVVSQDSLALSPRENSGTITLTAEGGPATWSISQPGGQLSVSPGSGTLTDGQSVQVTIGVIYETGSTSTYYLTVEPGGSVVAVTLSDGGHHHH